MNILAHCLMNNSPVTLLRCIVQQTSGKNIHIKPTTVKYLNSSFVMELTVVHIEINVDLCSPDKPSKFTKRMGKTTQLTKFARAGSERSPWQIALVSLLKRGINLTSLISN